GCPGVLDHLRAPERLRQPQLGQGDLRRRGLPVRQGRSSRRCHWEHTGKAEPACHFSGRTREEWGDERAAELQFFEAKRLKEHLDVSLQRVTETLKAAERKLNAPRRALVRVARGVDEPLGIVAKSPAMRRVVDLASRVAKVDSTLLITGESGAGKE